MRCAHRNTIRLGNKVLAQILQNKFKETEIRNLTGLTVLMSSRTKANWNSTSKGTLRRTDTSQSDPSDQRMGGLRQRS